jgi:hypothetical protein
VLGLLPSDEAVADAPLCEDMDGMVGDALDLLAQARELQRMLAVMEGVPAGAMPLRPGGTCNNTASRWACGVASVQRDSAIATGRCSPEPVDSPQARQSQGATTRELGRTR